MLTSFTIIDTRPTVYTLFGLDGIPSHHTQQMGGNAYTYMKIEKLERYFELFDKLIASIVSECSELLPGLFA